MQIPRRAVRDSQAAGRQDTVQAYEKEHRGDLDPNFQPTALRFAYARRTAQGADIRTPEAGDIALTELRGEGDIEKLAASYRYSVSTVNVISYLEPHDMLYEINGIRSFPLCIDAVFKGDADSTLTLPLSLIPKKPDPLAEWRVEYEKLVKRVERLTLPANRARYLNMLERLNADNSSVYELRLMNKDLVRAYMEHWSLEGRRELVWDSTLATLELGAGLVDFIGDCAFSYLIHVYGGGPFVEAVLSPAKDLLEELAGRLAGALWRGDSMSTDGLIKMANEAVKSAFDDILYEMIPAKQGVYDALSWKTILKKPSLKKLGKLLASYFLLNFVLNFVKNLANHCDEQALKDCEKRSVKELEQRFSYSYNLYQVLVATFQDMGKRLVGEMLGRVVKNNLNRVEVQHQLQGLMRDFAHWQLAKRIRAEFRLHQLSGGQELFGAARRYREYGDLYREAGERLLPQANETLKKFADKLIDKGYGYACVPVTLGAELAYQAAHAIAEDALPVQESIAFETDAGGKPVMITTLNIRGSDTGYRIYSQPEQTLDNGLDGDLCAYLFGEGFSFPERTVPMPKDPPLAQELR